MKKKSAIPLCGALALGLLAGTIVEAREIYRWVDAEGTVNYGQSPPTGVDAERVRGARAPASGDSQADEPETADTAQEEPGSASAQVADQERRSAREEQCAGAEENLAVLEDPATRRIQTEGGEAEPLTEERREALIAENREFLDEWCD